MSRAIDALKVCRSKLVGRNVARARLIATEACRLAANGEDFVERVSLETGLALEVVNQETEARLAVAGCASLVDPGARGVILFDIGGGSSELVWIDLTADADGRRRRMTDRIRAWMSLPVGVVNASERHGGRHVTPELFETMVGEVMEMLAGFPEVEALDQAVAAGGVHLLGTSGTVTTLAGVHLQLPRYDRRRVDGVWLSGDQVENLVVGLVAMDYEARVANPCIGRERADLVLAGCAILEAVRRRWPCKRLRVADRGLREGVLVELMAEDGVWRRRRSGRHNGDRRNG
jgi:exopolyphosphatase/guanosine-5'-triphosphate,3'-diphosphate pyrophosphatase